jgi:hypothetical protein
LLEKNKSGKSNLDFDVAKKAESLTAAEKIGGDLRASLTQLFNPLAEKKESGGIADKIKNLFNKP